MALFSVKVNEEKLKLLLEKLKIEVKFNYVLAKFKTLETLPAETFYKPEGFKVVGELVSAVGECVQESGRDWKAFIENDETREEIASLIDDVAECSIALEPFDGMFIRMILNLLAKQAG